jgi:hypothetical protein
MSVPKPHEEVIGTLVESIADAIRIQGFIRDPLIVDRDEFVILDGMHRYSSLKLLKCRFAPCCLVDYDSPLIKVGSWFRLFDVQEPESLAEKLLTQNNLKYTKRRTALDQEQPSDTIIITSRNQYSLMEHTDLIEFSRTAVMLEKAMVNLGHHVDYLSEEQTIQNLKSSLVNFVIALPIFSKQQIREFGIKHRLLPHKVTRHVMPSRPLRTDVPLQTLNDPSTSLADANRKLGETLSVKHVERKPPGSVVDGRRYEEELLVFAG